MRKSGAHLALLGRAAVTLLANPCGHLVVALKTGFGG